SRIAEGGPPDATPPKSLPQITAQQDTSASTKTHAKEPSAKKDELELFGADSDESDDDATIDRYAGDGAGDVTEDAPDTESKKVSTLLSKLSPEELFRKYDTDGSGNISVQEFLAMLPDLGITMSDAKATRIFKKCDTDGGGEIDLNEFKMAMFSVDPVSGNTLGFSPSSLLAPRDAFELFDTDGTGQIDELEFADVLEYFGMNVSDEKQETMFKKYDKDKSGYIDYKEFRSMWIRLSNVREELTKRGVEIPKYATPWKLQQILETILDEEEAREALVFAEAQNFMHKQREKERRQLLGKKAVVRAQDELTAALDAAGQVYIFGTGKYDQFAGEAVIRDEALFPGFTAVREIWSFRVNPKPNELQTSSAPSTNEPHKVEKPKQAAGIDEKLVQERKRQRKLAESKPKERDTSKYVRRRPENKRWKFQSPPKLNRQTIQDLKVHRTTHNAGNHDDDNTNREILENQSSSGSIRSETEAKVEPIESELSEEHRDVANENGADDSLKNEELAKLFFEDREFVRSLRFRLSKLMTNTGLLWGRGVLTGTLAENVAYVVTSTGNVLTWGGKSKTSWESAIKKSAIDFGSDSSDEENEPQIPSGNSQGRKNKTKELMSEKAPELHGVKDPKVEARAEELLEVERRQKEENERYERLKCVVMYYDVWELLPSNATRMLFMEQVLIPRLDYETMVQSVQLRGLNVERITKMDLILLLGECFELEREIRGQEGHLEFIATEERIKTYNLNTKSKKLLESWKELKAIREERQAKIDDQATQTQIDTILRADHAFETKTARHKVQMEDITPEYTTRGGNLRIDMSGITTRSMYTWGNGTAGRLGHQLNENGALCYDSDHPQFATAFQDVSIRYVACAHSHSAAISSDGNVYAWGSTSCGKLGVGIVDNEYEQFSTIPLLVKFPGKRQIRSMSCGAAHTGAVTTTGELFMWGCANGGRLGLGNVVDTVVVPTLVRELVAKKVRVWHVSCGSTHSAVCSEIVSDFDSGSKKLRGGQVYVCGGSIPLGRQISTWELVPELNDIGIRQVSCGVSHTGAVSAYGELYTWGRNNKGCTGHAITLFLPRPRLLKCLHVEPYNLLFGKPCRQISVYNEQGPQLAVNGAVDGTLGTCIHTHLEDKPWWEVNLGQPAVIERIRVWNRTDVPLNPSKARDEYTGRLFPFWILVSEFEFKDLEGKEGLRAAKVQSSAFELFKDNKRMTEWVLPTANTVGQYVRIQLQNRNFLHIAEVEVFGVYSAFKTVGRVGSVHCANEVTMVVVPPTSQESVLEDYYLRAIQADADNATILRQFDAFARSYRKFGRGDAATLGASCRLCRMFRECEICELYSQTKLLSTFADENGELPTRVVGDRMGLQDLVEMVVNEDQLEAEEQEKLRQQEEAARQEAERQAALAKQLADKDAKLQRRSILGALQRRPPAIVSRLSSALPFRKPPSSSKPE
uniref:EF-hand domain-containing protein n=1 Tax=Globisporangium ultimum (strain ATCC 200006 / CBS 805.95 / DAOM BR144) TaxID=431595 RepID=K3X146_GLOUD